MTAKKTTDYTAQIKTAAAEVQAKAKLALAKGSEVLGEAKTFTKGNVEAIKSSGKILGAGLQELGKTYVAEGKSAYATVTGDVKELEDGQDPDRFRPPADLDPAPQSRSCIRFWRQEQRSRDQAGQRSFRAALGPRQPGRCQGQEGRLISGRISG